jgi:hypothetical protein
MGVNQAAMGIRLATAQYLHQGKTLDLVGGNGAQEHQDHRGKQAGQRRHQDHLQH